MYGLPPPVLFNEVTGRLELQHAEIARRIRRTNRLRSRYRSTVIRRLVIAGFKTPWGGAVAACRALSATRWLFPRAPAPRATPPKGAA